ncbi:hypothetical protein [Microlunatus sp. Y2014]|uniref:hypothetical protein n=1 Tax=Microlunatus sp. Y2014 TaxID=3418488 RepID=UPI003DA6D0B8
MALKHPLSEQCTATSKRSGVRCKQNVIGGGVCPAHGGKAPQVKAKREARIMVAEAAMRGVPVVDRSPGEALLAAARDADAILQRLKAQADGDRLDRASLGALGEWIDRTARVTKTVVESKVDEAVVQRQQAITMGQAEEMAALLAHALNAARLTESQKDRVLRALPGLVSASGRQELAKLLPADVQTYPAERVVREVKVPHPVFIQLPKRRELTTGRQQLVTWLDGVPIYEDRPA